MALIFDGSGFPAFERAQRWLIGTTSRRVAPV
jgi:hypothetical protein